MTRFYLTAISLILISQLAIGQTILKKKEVQSKLEIISSEIEKRNFENAINIFFSKTEIIQKENVSKKMIDKYNSIEITLTQKKTEFDKNKIEVEKYKKYYESKEYCKSTELLSLNLTNENSYKESQQIQAQQNSKLIEAKQKCETNNEKLTEWEAKYKSNDFEHIYPIFDISYSEKNYYSSTDIERLEKLQNQLQPKFSKYKAVKNEIIAKPERIINGIDFNTLTYEQSEKLKLELININNTSMIEIKKVEGNNPILIKNYNEIKSRIDKTLIELHKFSEANKPLTNSEISQKVFSGKDISIDFIENKCKKGDADIFNIYDLDVFYYYSLEGYDTDLKKEVYKKSKDYQEQLAELKKLRTDLFNTTYYVKEEELFNSVEYDIKKKGFNLTINTNWGMGTASAKPPKSVSVAYGFLSSGYVQLKKLPSIEVADNFFGQGIKNEMLFIPVDEIKGLEIEENKEDIVVYYLFKPSNKESVKYKFYNNVSNSYAGWYDMTSKVITSLTLRIIVANKNSGKIYYDKIY